MAKVDHPELVIYVGNCQGDVEVDIDFSEIWADMLPAELVSVFDEFFDGLAEKLTVRVYTETLINWIGQQIDTGRYDCTKIVIITEHGRHRFGSSGVLDDSWPYGIFNY